jgi:hypothetical protein
MFKNTELENKLKYSHTIDNNQAIWAEWNLNQSYNISKVGNYRYRPGTADTKYGILQSVYDSQDADGYYTGATDSNIIINAGFDDSNNPALFTSQKKRINLLYSLDECFKQNRPRSGINKLLYLGISGAPNGHNQYIDSLTTTGEVAESGYSATVNIARRPRYYMASRYDDFKYWTSYRTEVIDNVTQEFGISLNSVAGSQNSSYYIYDAVPFVVYNSTIPTNKIVVKMQTNVGEVNNGPYRVGNSINIPDPLYGEQNKTVPKRWAIQKLDEENQWVELISFTENSVRSDGSPIIGSDGQVEIEYGLAIPSLFADVFTFVEEIYSTSMLPDLAPYGYAYLYKESETDAGHLYISDGGSWQVFDAQYSWTIANVDITKNTKVVKKLSNPDYFIQDSVKKFREFEFINGLRIVVDTMNKINSTFDLIELSPRLIADITNKVQSFSVTKTLSDLATHSMPTGTLLASTGSISIFDDDLSFNENNTFNNTTNLGSIVSPYSNSRIKFLFYDIVKNVNDYDYYIPIKTLYSERIPQVSDTAASITFELRDLFFLLESKKSPELLLTNVSLSYAITVLLDSIGFSNYVFKRAQEDEELIIPFFFVGPDQNIAETLQQLAISSQTAMFFDEYNDLVVMSKNYLLPSSGTRATDLILYGQEEVVDGNTILPNIINISSQEKKVYNGGEINYTTRYIQKSIGSIAQAPYIDEYKTYIYKPVLLWEVAGQEATKTVNESATQSSGYSLAAMPLKTALTSSIPEISGGELINNIIDFGESVYWLGNYAGYFYANGEVIRYDAVEYAVTGVGIVWIKNNQEYQNYFSQLKFNGKMYPTGRVRIYTNVDGTSVVEHGRGQFGTDIVLHPAGVEGDSTWVDDNNVKGSIQNAKDYLFNTNVNLSYPTNTGIDEAGNTKIIDGKAYDSKSYAIKSTRNGIIKNFMANTNITENDVNYYKTVKSGSVQTSALVFNGPALPTEIDPVEFVTYSYKQLDKPYKHFGTRMRIIGKVESGTNKDQTPIGAFDIYPASEVASGDPSKQISISGGSGGIAFGLNKDTNVGYYFEIAALTQNSVSSYKNNSNVASYKISTNPIINVVSDTVTVSLTTQHDFEVGTRVIVSGAVDDNNKIGSTRINGEFTVTEISQDRKMFKYIIPAPTTTIASITAAIGDGAKIVYTADNHSFVAGQRVTITGMSNSSYNLSNVVITAVENPLSGPDTFTVAAAVTGSLSAQTGTATYQVLTTTASTGGTVSQVLDSDTLISNVFFYKVISGSNTADIIKKQRDGNSVTMTTLRDHDFVKGEYVVISDVDSSLNGSYQITEIGSKYFKYNTSSSGTIALTDVDPIGLATAVNKVAIPEILWRGFTEILVDDGKFTTQSRLTTSEKTTVYDLSAEFLDIGTTRQFYLYLNNKQVAVITDTDPIPQYNNIALFVRGSSRVMFENIYALSDNFAENTARALQLPVSKIFGDDLITESEAIKKYAISGMVQNTYMSGISSESDPRYSLYYDEFGTIMREAAYFNIRYDRAFPALYAKIAETLNRVRGYTVSGFIAGSYGAEFLIFNAIDKNLNLDDTSGNYLRILGIAFTQNTTHSLKVDDFFKKNSNFTNALYSGTVNAEQYKQIYNDVLNSRNKYGRNDFTIDAQYVQTDAAAESMMDWIVKKVIYPRKTVGVTVFGVPHLQLGDIVQINYKSHDIDIVADDATRFVVYNIESNKDSGSISTTIHLAEV